MPFDYKKIAIPHRPGCYLYKDRKGEVIYVGKAKDLSKRVPQYFNRPVDAKTRALVNAIADVEFITTDTEVEALLLEQSLIHKYNPKYNIDLKGSVRYAYIKVTDDEYPRIITARKVGKDGRYYGPYTDGTARRTIIRMLEDLFKIRTCTKLPKKICLQYHIGRCLGPCEGRISREEYMANIRNAERMLKGDFADIVGELETAMQRASREQKYELAQSLREQIAAVELIAERQKIELPKDYDQDVINWHEQGAKIYFQIFNVKKGVITSRHRFTLGCYDGVVENFIAHYYSINPIPAEIIVPRALDDQDLLRQYLVRTKETKFALTYVPRVDIVVPEKGDKKKLLDLVRTNIEMDLGMDPGVADLQRILRLDRPPRAIDFFDMSTIQGKYNVGARIRLLDGREQKSAYRKFKVKWHEGQDDFAGIYEVVRRAYTEKHRAGGVWHVAGDKPQATSHRPDLIVIDGGRGQLNAAVTALAELGVQTPVISLAKKEEEIYIPQVLYPMDLDDRLPGMKLLIRGRDEVHRFVITYHRLLRSKGMLE